MDQVDRVCDEFVHERILVLFDVVVVVENVEPSLVVEVHWPLFANHNNLSTVRLQHDCFSMDTIGLDLLVHDKTFD